MGKTAVIIGAGHNGLVCAYYLARAGFSVEMFEAREIVGGAAVTEEFHPGFRNSTASYTVGLLDPAIIADMALHDHGLHIVERPLANFLPVDSQNYLLMGGGKTAEEVAKYSARDAAMLPEYERRIGAVATLLRYLSKSVPPDADGGARDLFRAIGQARAAIRLPLETQHDAIQMLTRSAREFLDGFFESDPIKALLGFDSVVGAYHSPDTPGSAYVLLHHVFGEVNGQAGEWGHAIGGMGSITQAMARSSIAAGVKIHTGNPIRRVLSANGKVEGVETAEGITVKADIVIGNVHPKRLLLDMVDEPAIDPAVRKRLEGYKSGSGTFRMNVALSELPRFTCAFISRHHHCPEPRLYGPRLFRRARAWLVPRTDCRDADTINPRRQPRARWPACRQPVLPAIRSGAGLGYASRRRGRHDHRHG
jgi:phytoene dehydrogenase-like protein